LILFEVIDSQMHYFHHQISNVYCWCV